MTRCSDTSLATLWALLRQSWRHRPEDDRLPDHIRAEAGLPAAIAWPVASPLLRIGVN